MIPVKCGGDRVRYWKHEKVDWTEESLSEGNADTGRRLPYSYVSHGRETKTILVHAQCVDSMGSRGRESRGHRDGESQAVEGRGGHQTVSHEKVTWLKSHLQENSLVGVDRLL